MNTEAEPDINQQKYLFAKRQLDALARQFPEDEWKHITSFGGIDVIICSADQSIDAITNLENGYSRIRQKIGPSADTLFKGIRVLIAPDTPGGGQALPRLNTIILDGNKMNMSVGEMEDLLSLGGEYRSGDQSKLVGRDANASELGFVHELGHILEYRAHTDMDIGFSQLNQESSPTLYGQKSPREDYAESWLYYIYDGALDEERLKILQEDIERLTST